MVSAIRTETYTDPPMFRPLPPVPDHPALEQEILAWWDERGIFGQLRERNRGGPRWSFIDGPITANGPMGVHHAWGRTLKDVLQRYKAMQGFDERYQNGFDCQGLWVEVEVEKSLGLNSKREIEEYGLAAFAERCKERVTKFAGVISEQSRRLGMWMDWENSYYTFSDTNIEYIWRFLKALHERGWLYKGHRSTQWCPRCGTSLSQHEQTGDDKYQELTHPSLYVRFPLKGRVGESLVIWTTTPWTLPANVAAAVKPDARYGKWPNGDWVAVDRYSALGLEKEMADSVLGEELVGLEYEGPFDLLPAQEGVVHRVITWEDVVMDVGTGIVNIAPGARPACPRADRRVGPLLPRGRLARWEIDGRGRGPDRARPRGARPARRSRRDHPPLPDLLAVRYAPRLPRCRRLVHCVRRDQEAPPRCQPGRRVDAGLLLEAHGRLA